MAKFPFLKDTLDGFGKFVVQQSKSNLSKGGKRDTSKLYRSLKYNTKVSPNSFELSISMEDYGDFVDKGVKGVKSSFKAPRSPYKFGTGTGRKGGLTNAIQGWVARKRFQFRDNKGKFRSFESTANTIIRSIWLTGIRSTEFYSIPFELAFKRLPEEVVEAFGLDVETLVNVAFDDAFKE